MAWIDLLFRGGDEGLLEFIRASADTAFHFCGTARIGADDMAVLMIGEKGADLVKAG